MPVTPPPATVPDIRSLFLGFYYNFSKLPDEPMRPRIADDRIGYFMNSRYDFSSDSKLTPRVNYIHRWRLEKKDPAAEMSEPKQPIVFWLDRNIPEKYRQAVIDGVQEWNKHSRDRPRMHEVISRRRRFRHARRTSRLDPLDDDRAALVQASGRARSTGAAARS